MSKHALDDLGLPQRFLDDANAAISMGMCSGSREVTQDGVTVKAITEIAERNRSYGIVSSSNAWTVEGELTLVRSGGPGRFNGHAVDDGLKEAMEAEDRYAEDEWADVDYDDRWQQSYFR